MCCDNQQKCVLLVDDEIKFAESLAKRISLRGYTVDVAHTGGSALELLGERGYPVMLLDLRLPDMDGIEVLRLVKASYPMMEVIIITGHGSETDRQECFALGAQAFLRKPLQFTELMDLVASMDGGVI